MKVQPSFAIFILLHTLIYSTEALRNFSYSRTFLNSTMQLVFSPEYIGDNQNIAYGLCKPYSNLTSNEKSCKIFLEFIDYNDQSNITTISCDVVLKLETNVNDSELETYWFHERGTIISLSKYSYSSDTRGFWFAKFVEVDDCDHDPSSGRGYYFQNQEGHNAFKSTDLEDHQIETIIREKKIYGIRLNYSKRESSAWFQSMHENATIHRIPIEINGFWYVFVAETFKNEMTRISLVGDPERVFKDFNGTTEVKFLVNKNVIGICIPNNETLRLDCGLYSTKLKPKLKISLDLGYNPKHGVMHELNHGGFLLATANCFNKSCENPKDYFDLKRIDSQGKITSSFRFNYLYCNGFGFSNKVILNIYKNQASEWCLARLCFSSNKFNVINKCFDDNGLDLL